MKKNYKRDNRSFIGAQGDPIRRKIMNEKNLRGPLKVTAEDQKKPKTSKKIYKELLGLHYNITPLDCDFVQPILLSKSTPHVNIIPGMENDFLDIKGRKHYDPENHDVLCQQAYPILASKLEHGKVQKPNRLSLYIKNVSNLAGINTPHLVNSHAAKNDQRRNTKKLDFEKI